MKYLFKICFFLLFTKLSNIPLALLFGKKINTAIGAISFQFMEESLIFSTFSISIKIKMDSHVCADRSVMSHATLISENAWIYFFVLKF